MEDPLTRLATLPTLSPKGARAGISLISTDPLGGEGARGTTIRVIGRRPPGGESARRAATCVIGPRPRGGEGAQGARVGEGGHASLGFAKLTRRRYRLCVPGALALAALALLAAAGCKRAPAAPSHPISSERIAQPPAAATTRDAAPAPVRISVAQPRFAVQVAAVDDRPAAEALASRLSDHFGLQTLVAPVEAKGSTYYRVRLLVGSKDDADKLAETFLRTENLKVWIVPL